MSIAQLAARLAMLEAQHPPGQILVIYPEEHETTEAALVRLGLTPRPHDYVIVVVYEDSEPDALDL
jgi:hypothetical protein